MAAPSDVPIGLQLYSVRQQCQADDGRGLAGVIAAVAKMGYDGVEFAGYHGWDASDLRKMLDDNALLCCGTHVGIGTLLGDELDRSVEFSRAIGNRFLIVPGLGPEYCDSLDAWARTAGVFNEIAERLRPHGMLTGYHNHFHEFEASGGRSPWDVLVVGTSADVVMQLDVGNAMTGGGDCAAILKQYPGRTVTLHLKEFDFTPATVPEAGLDVTSQLEGVLPPLPRPFSVWTYTDRSDPNGDGSPKLTLRFFDPAKTAPTGQETRQGGDDF